jgi:hypothetical protein
MAKGHLGGDPVEPLVVKAQHIERLAVERQRRPRRRAAQPECGEADEETTSASILLP